jgi:hypothetical protein
MDNSERWPFLMKDDDGLLEEIHAILTARVQGDPYSEDGGFAENLLALPMGLRAMAASHWLDISLTLDSITWHFGNFGEPGLVAHTTAALRELELLELAAVFDEAKDLMIPLLKERIGEEDPNELLDRKGVRDRADQIDRRAWALDDLGPGQSLIYSAWVRYAREHPERVFDA